ncbi:MAG: glycosyltransferase family 39 protein [Chloroflexota bacterium]
MRRIGGYSSIAVLLLAFGLRVYHLGFQATLSDDALGLMLAKLNPPRLFAVTATEPFPPTFYLSLNLWTRLAGRTEFAGRYYSLAFSLLSVALMWVLGRQVLARRAGLIGAFLLAINPFDIFFAQEVRMYSLVTCFCLGSSLFAHRLIFSGSSPWRGFRRWTGRGPWIGYTLFSLAAAMTHAFSLFVLLAQNVVAFLAGPRAGGWLRRWAASQFVVTLAFAIWAALVVSKLGAYRNALVSAPPLPVMLWRSFSAYALAFSPPVGAARFLPDVLTALALAGLAWLVRLSWAKGGRPTIPDGRQPALARQSLLFLACYLLVPFVTVWAISAVKPIYYERYMLIGLPPFLLFASAGLMALVSSFERPSRRATGRGARQVAPLILTAAAVLLVAVPTAAHLKSYYRTPVYARGTDMRALASYVSSVRNPVVITNVAPGDPLYAYYLPANVPVASTQAMRSIDTTLTRLTQTHSTLWFLPFGHSSNQHQAFQWLFAHAYPAGSRWFGNAQVLGFAAPVPQEPAASGRGLPVAFGSHIRLTGVSLNGRLPAGDPLDVTLHWLAEGKPTRDYSVFLHLIDAGGMTVAQHDGIPVAGTRPTTTWSPGERLTDRHGLLTPRTLPPGRYRLQLGLYDAAGKRLPVGGGGQSAIVTTVEVSASP